MKFPEHKASLHLTHNEHKSYCVSVGQYAVDYDLIDDFESEEAFGRACETDEVWVLQWYPNTPVGFCRVAAPTLDEALRLANGN